MKKTAAVAELKAQLSSYIRRVKAGEEIIVTERKIPVARIIPIQKGAPEVERLRDLEARGLMRIGRGGIPKNFWRMPLPNDPKGSVLKALLEERRDGR